MSAGEVERLVSELSGGTGGDEEEEWLYGGTELPVPSLSPGFSQAFPAGLQTAGIPGPSRRGLGPLVGSRIRPDLGRARRARPPPLGLLARLTPPTRTHPRRPAWPQPPASRAGGSASPPPFPRVSYIDSELCWFVCCPLALGCPSCPFFPRNSHSVIIAK